MCVCYILYIFVILYVFVTYTIKKVFQNVS